MRHAGQMDQNPGLAKNSGLPDDHADPDVDRVPASSIVVGHDGSGAATAALRFALQLASELGAPVAILRAWLFVTAPRPANWAFGYVPSTDEFADAVRTELISDTQSELARFPDVSVTHRVYHANPGQELDHRLPGCSDAGRRLPWTRRVRGTGAGLGQRPMRSIRTLPRARHSTALELNLEAPAPVA